MWRINSINKEPGNDAPFRLDLEIAPDVLLSLVKAIGQDMQDGDTQAAAEVRSLKVALNGSLESFGF